METDGGGGGGGVGAAVRDVPLGLGEPAEVGAGQPDDPVRPLPPQRRADPGDRRHRARPGREGRHRLGRRHQPGPEPDHALDERPAHPPRPRRRQPALDRLRRLRRPDALAPDRRGQRHRQPAQPAPRLASSRSRGSTRPMPGDSKDHVAALHDHGQRRRARPRRSATGSRRSGSSTTCACPTSARSASPIPRPTGSTRIRSSSAASSRSGSAPRRSRRPRRCSRATSSRSSRRSARAASPCSCARSTARTCCTARAACGPSRTRPRATSSAASCKEHGLTLPVRREPRRVYEFIMQDNVTDWDFIWRLAERAGFEFVVEDEHGQVPQAGQRRDGRARVAQDAHVLQPARDRRPAGQVGQPRHPRSEDQAEDREDHELQPGDAGGPDRPRALSGRKGLQRGQGPHRDRAGQDHGRGRRRHHGAARRSSPTATSRPRASRSATPRSRPGR